MKRKRLIIGIVVAGLVVAYGVSIAPNFPRRAEWKKTVAALKGIPPDRFVAAIQDFTRKQQSKGQPLPAMVPLKDLVSGGYLRPDDIRGLEDKQAMVSLPLDETRLQSIWVRVRSKYNRYDIALMGDGGVQFIEKE